MTANAARTGHRPRTRKGPIRPVTAVVDRGFVTVHIRDRSGWAISGGSVYWEGRDILAEAQAVVVELMGKPARTIRIRRV